MKTDETPPKRGRGKPRRAEGLARNRAWWVDDARHAQCQAAAEAEGISLGEWLISAADARLKAPDYAAIVRTLLADPITKTRLEYTPHKDKVGDWGCRLDWIEWLIPQARTERAWRQVIAEIQKDVCP